MTDAGSESSPAALPSAAVEQVARALYSALVRRITLVQEKDWNDLDDFARHEFGEVAREVLAAQSSEVADLTRHITQLRSALDTASGRMEGVALALELSEEVRPANVAARLRRYAADAVKALVR